MTWPEQIHENQLITAPGDDEFSNFLEFNMQFTDLDGHGPTPQQLQDQQHSMVPPTTTAADQAMASDPRSHPQFASPMEGLAMDFNGHGSMQSQMQPQMQSQPGQMPYSTPSMTPGFCAQDASSHHQQPSMSQQQGRGQQHYMQQGQQMIPPTPNSMELHGNAARYPQRVDDHSEMYDRYSRINEEQVCPRISRLRIWIPHNGD